MGRIRAFFQESYRSWIDFPLREGTQLEHLYRIERVIGAGSYGIAYEGRKLQTGEKVLLKHNKPSKGTLGRKLLEREFQIMSELNHPGIPKVYEQFNAKSRSFIVTEFIEGKTLEQLIFDEEVVLSERSCLEWTLKLMDVVSYIHAKGVVHLDIRIPNVIVFEDHIHLIDFGLARTIGSSSLVEREEEETRVTRPAEIESDLSDIGHFLLFLLYSAFQGSSHSDSDYDDRSWQEELEISNETRHMLEKLLQIQAPYKDSNEFIADLQTKNGDS